MLIDVMSLPSHLSIYNYNVIFITNKYNTDLYKNAIELDLPNLNKVIRAGSNIKKPFGKLYKAIYCSHKADMVFEVVFSADKNNYTCLYVRTISYYTTNIGISRRGVSLFRNDPDAFAISDFIRNLDNQNIKHSYTTDIVPAIVSKDSLKNYLHHLLKDADTDTRYDYVKMQDTGMYYGLINGMFLRSPKDSIIESHPNISFTKRKWSLYEEITYLKNVSDATMYLNHRSFDEISLKISNLPITDIEISYSWDSIVESHSSLNIINRVKDPYGEIHRFDEKRNKQIVDNINIQISSEILKEYFNLNYINAQNNDPDWIRSFYKSSVTIYKSCYEEVAVVIRDNYNKHNYIFYTSLPSLFISTLSIGRIISK